MVATLPGLRTFSYEFSPRCRGPSRNWAQLVFTAKGAWAKSPEWRPSADTQWVPGAAEAGTVTGTGPKFPVLFVPARARSVVSTNTSAPSNGPNPAPDTMTVDPGRPVAGVRMMPGVTVNVAVLAAVPPGAVTDTGPVA